MNKLKLTVEYNADPLDYQTCVPSTMAKIDQEKIRSIFEEGVGIISQITKLDINVSPIQEGN